MFSPGDVVVIDFPGVTGVKRRPTVILSSPIYHASRPDVVVGLITSQTAALGSTDYVLQDWAQAGLRVPSVFRGFFHAAARYPSCACRPSLGPRLAGRMRLCQGGACHPGSPRATEPTDAVVRQALTQWNCLTTACSRRRASMFRTLSWVRPTAADPRRWTVVACLVRMCYDGTWPRKSPVEMSDGEDT